MIPRVIRGHDTYSQAFLANAAIWCSMAGDSTARLGPWLQVSFLASGERSACPASVQVQLRILRRPGVGRFPQLALGQHKHSREPPEENLQNSVSVQVRGGRLPGNHRHRQDVHVHWTKASPGRVVPSLLSRDSSFVDRRDAHFRRSRLPFCCRSFHAPKFRAKPS